ncbi:hypothetical protein BS78_03G024000 [Paspalum vaginatum]|nr:hypothetical protein BS78_03G024000 [Paspalum vaginatum]
MQSLRAPAKSSAIYLWVKQHVEVVCRHVLHHRHVHHREAEPPRRRVEVVAEAPGRGLGWRRGWRREREPAVGGRVADVVAGAAAGQEQPAVRRHGDVEHGDGALEEDNVVFHLLRCFFVHQDGAGATRDVVINGAATRN